MSAAPGALGVVAGAVLAFRLFDIAYEIDLAAIEQIWARQARAASTRSRLVATPPKAIAFGVAPVEVPLDAVSLDLDGEAVQAVAMARFYDFGIFVLALSVPASDLSAAAYTARIDAVDRCLGYGSEAPVWGALLLHVRELFEPAFVRPIAAPLQEDYLIGLVQQFTEHVSAAELQSRIDLVPLLSGERRPLSDGARAELLRHRFSYYTDDLVVLTWDRAFIYEPRGDSDVINVLEVANAQLLEMRYYDELLDAELPRMYDLVQSTRTSVQWFASRRYSQLAHRLYSMVAEVTELTEKVDNALQVTEDVYLARIYAAALELFRVPTVSAAVDRKLAIIRDTYAALYDEASGARSALMEFGILILIVIEVIVAVAGLR
jgi:hypothetical protein